MIERKHLLALKSQELERFRRERPRSLALLEQARKVMPDGVPMAWMNYHYEHPPLFVDSAQGARIVDVDGHRYLDMNLSDMSMATGYALPAVADAVDARFRKGAQLLLPTEDTIAVATELARRVALPRWQFTLAASTANTEAIRVARASTGRADILVFDGKYHGHIDPTLQEPGGDGAVPEFRGLPASSGAHTRLAPFNDLEALEAALRDRGVACVLTEPAFTTVGGVLMPDAGFHAGLRALTRRYGTLLIMDETHTHVAHYGGLSRAWGLEPDLLVLGKALGGGIPIGAYGLSEALARFMEQPGGAPPKSRFERVATGGTMFGNALQMAAARATLEHVLTEEAQARAATLGARLADGIERAIRARGLPWSVWRLYNRSGYHFAPQLPRHFRQLAAVDDRELRGYTRIYLANRGIWEAVCDAGPAVSLAALAEDIDLYLDALGSCFDTLVA